MTKKILLIDDEKDFVESVKEFFEMREYQVIAAYNGEEGLEKAKESPDIILLDIKMPSMDGFEVLRRMKDQSETRNTPIIMLTSKTDTEAIFEAQHLWATDYLMKPAGMGALLMMVKQYLDDNRPKPINI